MPEISETKLAYYKTAERWLGKVVSGIVDGNIKDVSMIDSERHEIKTLSQSIMDDMGWKVMEPEPAPKVPDPQLSLLPDQSIRGGQ